MYIKPNIDQQSIDNQLSVISDRYPMLNEQDLDNLQKEFDEMWDKMISLAMSDPKYKLDML